LCRGIRGGIAAQDLFTEKYDLKNPGDTVSRLGRDRVSAGVGSVLQAGAFFGTLTSAPISGMSILLLLLLFNKIK